jgi:hypothetical protein
LLGDRGKPFYWDLRLALEWLGGVAPASVLRAAALSRRAALRKLYGSMPLAAYDLAAENEMRYLLGAGRLKLEVTASG